jgi:capsule polysaccharide export protein KpsE/RkpR
MTVPAESQFDVPGLLRAARAAGRLALLAGAAVGVVTALVLVLSPTTYQGNVVVVPVQNSRASAGLAGAASFLGGALDLGSTGFDATKDVVAYLLRSRSVLLVAAEEPYQGQPLAVAIARRQPEAGQEERLLSALRRALRVTTSRETGFVTMTLRARDSGAVRAFLQAVMNQTQRLFTEVAQAQARQMVRAQERRVDSSAAELARDEDALLRFDEGNRALTPRSRLSLTRTRLERRVTDAARAYDQATLDRQSAIARALEDAPALAVVERLADIIAPRPRRVLFRSLLLGSAAAGLVLLGLLARELARSPRSV